MQLQFRACQVSDMSQVWQEFFDLSSKSAGIVYTPATNTNDTVSETTSSDVSRVMSSSLTDSVPSSDGGGEENHVFTVPLPLSSANRHDRGGFTLPSSTDVTTTDQSGNDTNESGGSPPPRLRQSLRAARQSRAHTEHNKPSNCEANGSVDKPSSITRSSQPRIAAALAKQRSSTAVAPTTASPSLINTSTVERAPVIQGQSRRSFVPTNIWRRSR